MKELQNNRNVFVMLDVKTKYGPNNALAGDNISTNNSTAKITPSIIRNNHK